MARGDKDRGSESRAARRLHSRLEETLSEAELSRVLTEALLGLDEAGLDRVAERLDADTAAAVRAALQSVAPRQARQRKKATKAPVPSKAKVRQEWAAAWNAWQACIFASGNEEGRYIDHQNDWDPPYLDTCTLATDLERAAERMLALVQRVVEDSLEPGLDLTTALLGSLDQIGDGLPEWIRSYEDCGPAGPQATRLALEWERRIRMGQPEPAGASLAFEVLDRLRTLEASSSSWTLDGEALDAFVADLDEPAQRALLAALDEHREEPQWVEALGGPGSSWFEPYLDLAGRFSPAKHLAVCRAAIPTSWHFALPVAEDLLEREAFEEAESVLESGLRSLLRLGEDERWSPTETLLVDHWRLRFWRCGDELQQLLLLRARCAAHAGDEPLRDALGIQALALEHWKDWDAMLEAFRNAAALAEAPDGAHLFADWRRLVAEHGEESDGLTRVALEQSWMPLLIDAARNGPSSASVLHGQLRSWLRQTETGFADFQRLRSSMGVLTLDLLSGAEHGSPAPALQARLEARMGHRSGPLSKSRRTWLQRLGVGQLLPEVLSVWRRYAEQLPPDPKKNSGARYDEHAGWLAVVRELDPAAYARLVRRWRRDHSRRRNLWQAVAARGLPVG